MNVTNVVAENVKRIREQKKLTLDTAAELTGVSRSMLAQIEKGDVNPTISVLWKIANGYKISFTSLVEPQHRDVAVRKQSEIQVLSEDEGRYLNYPVFPFEDKKLFECYRIVVEPGGSLQAQPHMRGAEEYIICFSGHLEICVDSTSYQLERGDSIRFMADVPHSYRNTGNCTAEMSMLIYYNS